MLVTLSLPDPEKPSSSKSLAYSIITQTQVSIDNSCCNPTSISNLISLNVGFEVVLLDSKCYPILHNEATTEFEFWKSTRKILAASKSCYEKLTGKTFSTTLDFSTHDQEVESTPAKRKCSNIDHNNIVEKVHNQVEKLQKNFDFLASFVKAFECVICRSI